MKTAKEKNRLSIDESNGRCTRSVRHICKGLTEEQVETLREAYGENKITKAKEDPIWKRFMNRLSIHLR